MERPQRDFLPRTISCLPEVRLQQMIVTGTLYLTFPAALLILAGALMGLVRPLRSVEPMICGCLGVGALARFVLTAN